MKISVYEQPHKYWLCEKHGYLSKKEYIQSGIVYQLNN